MESYQKQGGAAGTINPRSAKSVHRETCAEGKPDVDAGESAAGGRQTGRRGGKSPIRRELLPTESWQRLRPGRGAGWSSRRGRGWGWGQHQKEKAEAAGDCACCCCFSRTNASILQTFPELVPLKTPHLEQFFNHGFEILPKKPTVFIL